MILGSFEPALRTTDKFAEVRIHVDSALQELAQVSDGQRRRVVGEEELQLARIPVDLQQRVHVLRHRHLGLHPAGKHGRCWYVVCGDVLATQNVAETDLL